MGAHSCELHPRSAAHEWQRCSVHCMPRRAAPSRALPVGVQHCAAVPELSSGCSEHLNLGTEKQSHISSWKKAICSVASFLCWRVRGSGMGSTKGCCSCACCAAPLWRWCGFVHMGLCWGKVVFRGPRAARLCVFMWFWCCGWLEGCNLWDALRVVGLSVPPGEAQRGGGKSGQERSWVTAQGSAV